MVFTEIGRHRLLGGTRLFIKSPLAFIESMLEAQVDIAASKLFFKPWYFLCDPEAIDHVLNKKPDNYIHSKPYEAMKSFLGNSLMTNEGERWVMSRRVIKPLFIKERNRLYQQHMAGIMLSSLDAIDAEQPVNITEVIRTITLKVLCRTILGIGIDEQAAAIGHNLRVMQRYANKRMRSPFMWPLFVPTLINNTFKKALAELNSIIHHIIDNGLYKDNDTLIARLIESPDFKREDGTIDKQKIRDEVMTLFVGGQETTFSALTFISYLLAKNTAVQQKLFTALQAHEVQDGLDHRHTLSYLNCVIHEGLRLFPPVWAIGRKAVREDQFNGITIPRGATIFISVYGLHRNSHFWEAPGDFIPERFNRKLPGNAFIPFGKGPRVCVGANFGFQEIHMVLYLLIKKFRISLVQDRDIKVETLLTMLPKEDLWLSMKPR